MRGLMQLRRRNEGALNFLRSEVEDLFSKFFGEMPVEFAPGMPVPWVPQVDVQETEKDILVKADLPGIEPKDVEVTVENGTLILRGERKEEHEEKKNNYFRLERFHGNFYREVPLPVGADPEKIVANSSKGVVTVSIPKKPEVLPKKIPVKPLA